MRFRAAGLDRSLEQTPVGRSCRARPRAPYLSPQAADNPVLVLLRGTAVRNLSGFPTPKFDLP